MTSLNPVLTIGDQLMEVFRLHQNASREEARQTVVDNWKNGEYILDAESFKDVEFYPRGRSRDRDGR